MGAMQDNFGGHDWEVTDYKDCVKEMHRSARCFADPRCPAFFSS